MVVDVDVYQDFSTQICNNKTKDKDNNENEERFKQNTKKENKEKYQHKMTFNSYDISLFRFFLHFLVWIWGVSCPFGKTCRKDEEKQLDELLFVMTLAWAVEVGRFRWGFQRHLGVAPRNCISVVSRRGGSYQNIRSV